MKGLLIVRKALVLCVVVILVTCGGDTPKPKEERSTEDELSINDLVSGLPKSCNLDASLTRDHVITIFVVQNKFSKYSKQKITDLIETGFSAYKDLLNPSIFNFWTSRVSLNLIFSPGVDTWNHSSILGGMSTGRDDRLLVQETLIYHSNLYAAANVGFDTKGVIFIYWSEIFLGGTKGLAYSITNLIAQTAPPEIPFPNAMLFLADNFNLPHDSTYARTIVHELGHLFLDYDFGPNFESNVFKPKSVQAVTPDTPCPWPSSLVNCGRYGSFNCDANGPEHFLPVNFKLWQDRSFNKGQNYDKNAMATSNPYPGDNAVRFTSHQKVRIIEILETGVYSPIL